MIIGYYEHFLLALMLTTLSVLALGGFVFLQRPRKGLNITFALYSVSIAGWCFSQIGLIRGSSLETTYLWAKVLHGFVVFIPTFFLHFVSFFLRLKRIQFLIRASYVCSVVFLALCFSPLIISGARALEVGVNYGIPGLLYPALLFHFGALTLYCLWCIFRQFLSSAGIRKKRLKLFLVFSVLGYFGGSASFLLVYGVSIPVLNPFGTYLIAVYAMVTAWIVLRYGLFEIQFIIKKFIPFIVIFSLIVLAIPLFSLAIMHLAGEFIGFKKEFASYLAIALSMLIVYHSRLYNIVAEKTEKWFFVKPYDMKQIVYELGRKLISSMRRVEESAKLIADTLVEKVNIEACCVLYLTEDEKGYHIVYSVGRAPKQHAILDESHHLISYLREVGNPVDLERGREELPADILQTMSEFKAVLCLPLFSHNTLIGALFLGKKKSGLDFDHEDLELFPQLIVSASIGLMNARQYDDLIKREADFVQQGKMAVVGTLASGINHEVRNPLNIIKTGVEMLRMNEEDGIYDTYSPEKYKQEVRRVLTIIERQVEKANSIMTTLSTFAHKNTALKTEKVNLGSQVDNVYAFIKSEFKYNSIGFEKEVPSDLPLILADSNRVSEVLLNIINNARQAIGRDGKVKVSAHKNDKYVILTVSDNGPGMSKEIQEKIFDPFFTTKKQGQGTGLGLHLCREVLKRMDARIVVDSEVGRGTTFTISFPLLDESSEAFKMAVDPLAPAEYINKVFRQT